MTTSQNDLLSPDINVRLRAASIVKEWLNDPEGWPEKRAVQIVTRGLTKKNLITLEILVADITRHPIRENDPPHHQWADESMHTIIVELINYIKEREIHYAS